MSTSSVAKKTQNKSVYSTTEHGLRPLTRSSSSRRNAVYMKALWTEEVDGEKEEERQENRIVESREVTDASAGWEPRLMLRYDERPPELC